MGAQLPGDRFGVDDVEARRSVPLREEQVPRRLDDLLAGAP
ncbi:hypothetical protein ABZ353_24845 [Streptomyces niveus]